MCDGERFTVRVIDRAATVGARRGSPVETPASMSWPSSACRRAGQAESLTEEALAAGVGLALLAGLVDDLEVRPVGDGAGTEVRMSWPAAAADADTEITAERTDGHRRCDHRRTPRAGVTAEHAGHARRTAGRQLCIPRPASTGAGRLRVAPPARSCARRPPDRAGGGCDVSVQEDKDVRD